MGCQKKCCIYATVGSLGLKVAPGTQPVQYMIMVQHAIHAIPFNVPQ